jgi:DNA-directed RNA polymerase subunit RPC12/RpoP
MFRCDRCGSRYSAIHAAALENCPRCLVREKVSSPLTFKAFERLERRTAPAQEREVEPRAPSLAA